MKYIYGPVKSRRLGSSLGLSIVPYKTCSFDCVYCQLGKTTDKTIQRREYYKIEDVLSELHGYLRGQDADRQSISYITLSGAGEPTLNLKIAELISQIKRLTSIPVAVITNSSLLSTDTVRKDLGSCDLILPSLDAVTEDIFLKINRPQPDLSIQKIIEGLIKLRKDFRTKIYLEVMVVKGINDTRQEIKKLKKIIDEINPDKIHLNSPVRPPAEKWVLPVQITTLEKIKEILGERCEII